ncbi:MAG TPA: hypothetical protein P5514_14055 [Bacteroidales bacterium]|nr:hypothetical protein [Bacteroidales bacterium]HRX98067.1 hypothetical protein [Bacteroidales bacterium]
MATTTNNFGAISALKGYRVQFLYSLFRILSYSDSESEFHPEGQFEDLDIYNENNEILEVIQVKSYSNILTLSSILSNNDNSFIKRALKAYQENGSPKIKLISFGAVNADIKNLGEKNYSKNFIKKLKKLGLNENEIKILQDHFEFEIVDEHSLKKEIVSHIEKWNSFADIRITLDLLLYWVYHAAEKQNYITPKLFKEQFDKICRFERERISFHKTYNSLISPLINDIESENVDALKSDFYKGISATYKHILANVDVLRVEKLNSIEKQFKDSNIVFIHGASGQGKSTLAYRYLNENCIDSTVFELKHLPEEIQIIYEIIDSLEGISKGIKFPITIYIDVEPGNKEWIHIIKELASKKNFNFLITIREEDWNSIEVSDEFVFSEIELLFEYEEAELIYESLNHYNTDLRFIDFNDAWETFGGRGPLLEFVYLITQNESLSAKLKSQINKIRSDSSTLGNEKIKILRYIVLADCYGSKIKLKEFNSFLNLQNDILFLTELLKKEYLIKLTGDNTFIVGLHPVRSGIIKELLFDNEIHVASDFMLEAIAFVADNTILNFIRNGFRYSSLSVEKLLDRLRSYTPMKWQAYLLIFKSLLWKGISDYLNKNIEFIEQIYADYNKGWITVANFDFADVIEKGSLMQSSDIFSEEQRHYAQTINEKFSSKKEVFFYCLSWLDSIEQIELDARNKDDWDAFGLFLFWLHHLNKNEIIIDFESFEYEKYLNIQPVEIISHVLYSLKKYNKQSQKVSSTVESLFLKKLSQDFNIISIDQENNSINCHYLIDILDEQIDTDESDFIHAKSIKLIELLRFAFPDKESYGTKAIGHKFSFLPDLYDSSIKQIPRDRLPLKPLVEINSTYINLFSYTKRPKSWNDYVDLILLKRLTFVRVLKKLVYAFKESHRQKNYEPLRLYVLDYVKIKEEINKMVTPQLPRNVADEWGEFGENDSRDKSRPAISYKLYRELDKSFDSVFTYLDTFLWQSANVIISKIKSLTEKTEFDTNTARVSLVSNLFGAYEGISAFQEHFRNRFLKFSNEKELQRIEREELINISALCFLYRQFIFSNNFLQGNIENIAIKRISDTDSALRNKITNGFRDLSKELNVKFKVDFDNKAKRCIISSDSDSAIESLEILRIAYNKLFDLLEQPDYNSIKYLVLNTKYPTFYMLLLVSGKTINSKWYEFKTYNLREKTFEELEQFNLIPQDIPEDIKSVYKLEEWNTKLRAFKNLDKLLESTSTAYQLAFHLAQLEYFSNKEVEDYNFDILQGHLIKTSTLFQENLQSSIDLFVRYCDLTDANNIQFDDELDRQEFKEFLVGSHCYFYPNDSMFEKGEFSRQIELKIMEEWVPRLETLTNNVFFIYYLLAGKIIDGKMNDN